MARKRLLTLMLSTIFLLCFVGSALAADRQEDMSEVVLRRGRFIKVRIGLIDKPHVR